MIRGTLQIEKVDGKYKITLPSYLAYQIIERYKISEEALLKKNNFVCDIKKLKQNKTLNQLGYLYGYLFPEVATILQRIGYFVPPGTEERKRYAEHVVLSLPEIGFVYTEVNPITKEKREYIKSISEASRDEISHIISYILTELAEFFGVRFDTPEEYAHKRKLKYKE